MHERVHEKLDLAKQCKYLGGRWIAYLKDFRSNVNLSSSEVNEKFKPDEKNLQEQWMGCSEIPHQYFSSSKLRLGIPVEMRRGFSIEFYYIDFLISFPLSLRFQLFWE